MEIANAITDPDDFARIPSTRPRGAVDGSSLRQRALSHARNFGFSGFGVAADDILKLGVYLEGTSDDFLDGAGEALNTAGEDFDGPFGGDDVVVGECRGLGGGLET